MIYFLNSFDRSLAELIFLRRVAAQKYKIGNAQNYKLK